MINYKRTNWYGLAYLLRLRGSLLPHCIPAMIVAGALAGIFTLPAVTSSLGVSSAELFVDKYSMQLFGVVFGYIAVARLNVLHKAQIQPLPLEQSIGHATALPRPLLPVLPCASASHSLACQTTVRLAATS